MSVPRPAGRVIDARLHLLDRQVLDPDGVPVAVVADLELRTTESGDVVVDQLLFGSVFLARLIGGSPPRSRMLGVPWRVVTALDDAVRVGVRADSLDVTWVERWVRDHVIGRIPGARHDPE